MYGVSAQATPEQREFAARERIPYPLLSDAQFRLARALGLPTFTAGGLLRIRRTTLIARREDRRILYAQEVIPDTAADAGGTLAALARLRS